MQFKSLSISWMKTYWGKLMSSVGIPCQGCAREASLGQHWSSPACR